MASRGSNFVVVANRLPVDKMPEHSEDEWRASPGGLVSALEPVLRAQGGVWVGWPGSGHDDDSRFQVDGLTLQPVPLNAHEVGAYYEGMSNATLWPLYHDLVAKPEFHRDWWDTYRAVNQRFAEAAASAVRPGGVVWVHDYQLQLVPHYLRRLRKDIRIGFFLHIPFPPSELFRQLPWRDELLEGMLGADLVGFQRPGGASNFARLVRQLLKHKTHRDRISLPGRDVLARSYPISIDAKGFADLASSRQVRDRATQIRADLGNPEHVFLGVDRLDYTKGIKQRLRAFGELIRDGYTTVEESVFVQVASPSRERVQQYREVREDIEHWVGRINGDLSTIGRPAVHYLHSSFPREEMAALYRACDVMVVTPFADGMNLVAKEYVTCRTDNTGALVLSEFAGAADELKQAFLVNPHDINGLRQAMHDAITASPHRLATRMNSMRRQVSQHDIASWARSFLDDLGAAELSSNVPGASKR